nr:hypothetical protein [Baekduia soli]
MHLAGGRGDEDHVAVAEVVAAGVGLAERREREGHDTADLLGERRGTQRELAVERGRPAHLLQPAERRGPLDGLVGDALLLRAAERVPVPGRADRRPLGDLAAVGEDADHALGGQVGLRAAEVEVEGRPRRLRAVVLGDLQAHRAGFSRG